MNIIILLEIALGVSLLVIFALVFVVGKLLASRWGEMERRLERIEQVSEKTRLTHRDILNVENATAAVVKVLRDLENLEDYTRNSLSMLGKVRGLMDGDDE